MAFKWEDFSQQQLKSIDNSTARINIWEGAVRSGKTIASIVRWLDYIETGPEGDLLMIGKTHRTLKRNILDILQDIVGEKNYRYNRGLGEVYICGRKIYIAGANDARAEDKIRGMTLAGAYGDEVTIWPEGFFRMLLSRLSIKGAKLFVTTNPEGPYHWLKQDYLNRQDELSLNDFHFTLKDNLSLDTEYIKQLKREYTGVWYDRYILGKWTLAEGLIYDMYNPDIHLVNELPKMQQYWVGIDYGTSNATAFVLLGLGFDNKMYVIKEYKFSGGDMQNSKTDADYSNDFQEWIGDIKPKWIYVDPSAKSFRLQLWRDRNKKSVLGKVAKANNDVLDGIRSVSSLLSSGKLYIHQSCEELRKELTLYSWDEKAQEKGKDKPLEVHDHLCDALRYAVMGLGTVYDRL